MSDNDKNLPKEEQNKAPKRTRKPKATTAKPAATAEEINAPEIESAIPLFNESAPSEAEDIFAKKDDTVRRKNIKIVEKREQEGELVDELRQEPDLVRRARSLVKNQMVDFPEIIWKKKGEEFISSPESTDRNRIYALDLLFGDIDERPHFDMFSGREVDHTGEKIDGFYNFVPWLEVYAAFGLRAQSVRAVREAIISYSYASKWNSLVKRMERKVPEWDGLPRIEGQFVKMFKCFDTELNRNMSRYFWLSLYCRIMYPGCMAPIVASFIGTQLCGKSHFVRLICQYILGDTNAKPVQYDPSGNAKEFLRNITGTSVIASIPEMTGLLSSDMNRTKEFVTVTVDSYDNKFKDSQDKPRQWIMTMDGNKYEGLQRDETGNRRFYPIFCGQLPDKNGQPDWSADFKVDFENFESDFWQMMAECEAWIQENSLYDYERFVAEVAGQVKAFSDYEMKNNRGTISDSDLEAHILEILHNVEKMTVTQGRNKGAVYISTSALLVALNDVTRRPINNKHLANYLVSLGASENKPKVVKVEGVPIRAWTFYEGIKWPDGGVESEDVERKAESF
jgi:hypothetical protein